MKVLEIIAEVLVSVILVLTLPLWILPFVIIRDIKRGKLRDNE